jgi:hypothetical protein
MNNHDSETPIIAHWPGNWPGRQVVDLDNMGDPGAWIENNITSPEELLSVDSDDSAEAEVLADAYIAEADRNYFPLPTEFEMTEQEMREVMIADFLGFIREWRQRTIAAQSEQGTSS